MKGKFLPRVVFLLYILVLSSCQSYKKIPYLQKGWSDSTLIKLKTAKKFTDIKYKADDVLAITVNAVNEPSVASAFNLPLQPTPDQTTYAINQNASIMMAYNGNGGGRQTYLVSKDGYIEFPMIGKIKVGGMTRDDLESYLKEHLKKYIKEDPVITIRLMNYKISVLGEVSHPGEYSVDRDRINILQALSLAGDMTIYGVRDNVILVREEENGNSKLVRLNLNDVNLVSSPYYYLQQNDVVYVQPNKAIAKSADISSQTSLLVSLGSILLGIANLVITVTK